jgi:hypothetical protein
MRTLSITKSEVYKRFAGLIMVICLLAVSQSLTFFPSGTLKGRVTDKTTHEPIPFANVILDDEGTAIAGATTDFDGNFNIQPIEPGNYRLKVTFIGYKPLVVKDIRIIADSISVFNAEMEATSVHLSEVVVMDYKTPLISKDKTSVGATVTSSRKDRAKSAVVGGVEKKGTYSGGAKTGAGQLTAGEINDYAKWELWKDISGTDLKKWQENWKIKPLNRYMIQVISTKGMPVVDAKVLLRDKSENVIWSARTDNTGKAELWESIFHEGLSGGKNLSAIVEFRGNVYTLRDLIPFGKGNNTLMIETPCEVLPQADIAFMVDATGSMGDEIRYLKAELLDIMEKTVKNHGGINLRLGSVFYRDEGDDFVTRKSDLTNNFKSTVDFISKQEANGGGDYEEAVHTALKVAVNELQWNPSARARLLFVVLDAPPHHNDLVLKTLEDEIIEAASKGIRIIPVMGSGVDKQTEYLLRSWALATNGTYTFLTDDSGIGGTHLKPTTDHYDVKLLNALLQEIIDRFLYVPECLVQEAGSGKQEAGGGEQEAGGREQVAGDSVLVKTVAESGIEGIDEKIKIYPNPTQGECKIEFPGGADEIFLADVNGKLIERFIPVRKHKMELNIGQYPNGIYFVRCIRKGAVSTGKVILIH